MCDSWLVPERLHPKNHQPRNSCETQQSKPIHIHISSLLLDDHVHFHQFNPLELVQLESLAIPRILLQRKHFQVCSSPYQHLFSISFSSNSLATKNLKVYRRGLKNTILQIIRKLQRHWGKKHEQFVSSPHLGHKYIPLTMFVQHHALI